MSDVLIETKSKEKVAPIRVAGVDSLRQLVGGWKHNHATVALVPTMGALHDGHISLVKLARHHADCVIVSIFVNPAQFSPSEDFSSYPRSLDADLERLTTAGVDAVFMPGEDTIYPTGFATNISLTGPASAGLEDVSRPDHFSGVAIVVAKLHNMVQPDIAVYGEKDFQQLAVIRQMNSDLNLPVTIKGAPTIREPDGLAMSSRNQYLSASERAAAPALFRVLQECRDRILSGAPAPEILTWGRTQIEDAGFQIDYLELRDAQTLESVPYTPTNPFRLLVAAKIGTTRLIDNIAVDQTKLAQPAPH